MRRMLRNNGLSIVMFGLFFIFLVGQSMVGLQTYNDDQREHNQSTLSYGQYVLSGAFIEAVFENWESEFLQMGAYVIFTAFLFQKGSSESKDPDSQEDDDVDQDPRQNQHAPNVPWPVRRGGWVLKLYENSLSLALLALFALSFMLHAIGGAEEYSTEEQEHGGQPVSTIQYLGTSQFWFESLQNWQSEFLSVGVLIVLSVYLRQRGSPESKPVASLHGETGK